MTSEPKKNAADEPIARWEDEGGAPAAPKAPPSWTAKLKAALTRLWSFFR